VAFLLPIKPIAVGLPEVEAFDSFFARLAAAHGLTIIQLGRLISDWTYQNTDKPIMLKHISRFGTNISGYGPLVDIYLEAVSKVTNVGNLERLTLVPIRPTASSRTFRALKAHRSWCAQCLGESKENGEIWYDRLIWRVENIHHCLKHNIGLSTSCYKCGELQKYHHRSGSLDICWKCSSYLSISDRKERIHQQPASGEQISVALITAISTGELVRARNSAFEVYIRELRAIIKSKGYLLGKFSALVPLRYVDEKFSPTLMRMIEITKSSKADIVLILNEPVLAAAKVGVQLEHKGSLVDLAKSSSFKEAKAKLEVLINLELKKETTVPVLRVGQLAKLIGVSKRTITRYSPKQMLDRQERERREVAKAGLINQHIFRKHININSDLVFSLLDDKVFKSEVPQLAEQFSLSEGVVEAILKSKLKSKKLKKILEQRC